MSEIERDGGLTERRKTWKTVSFRGLTTYDAFSRDGNLQLRDTDRALKHKARILADDFKYIQKEAWDDVFVEPSRSDILAMYVGKVNTLIDLVMLPHTNVFCYTGPGIHNLQRLMGGSPMFPSPDEFLRVIRSLSMINGGADVIEKLTNDSTQDYFASWLKNKVKFVDGDFRAYKRQL